jgi:hypothetical protein
MSGPAQRSKWEVHIDGVHHGYVFYPLGVGNPWIGCLLEPQDLVGYDGEDGVRCWLGPTGEHGGWEETGGKWDGLLGLLKKLEAPDDLKRRGNSSYGFRIAPARPRLSRVLTGLARSHDARRVDEKIAAELSADKPTRKREDAERTARYAREAEADRQRRAREAAAAEELRQEVLAGLVSIQERYNGQLSNLEMTALTRALERYSKS